MTLANSNKNYPKTLSFSKKESDINLIINGQGVFIFETESKECSFSIYDNTKNYGLNIKFTNNNVFVNYIHDNVPLIDKNNKQGLTNNNGAYYWFSIDYQNQKLYAGIGEARLDNVIYQYQFEQTSVNKKTLECLVSIYLSNDIVPLKLLRDPITLNVPLLIKNTDELSMEDISTNKYLPVAYLSPIAQKLYNCISGKNFILNTSDFPDFSNAIEYSIVTPGCWCYETLKTKSTEFNPDKPNLLETYLRITLGQNNGESPGVPYVMEIWPPMHYSPIHNHGGSNAVIRVLHGSINVSLYAYLCDQKETIDPFGKVDFEKDDITWISPTLNQVHKLNNLDERTTCITIQCYMYGNNDNTHYDYFDYIDDDGKKQQFDPDSDMEFIKFKETIKKEWLSKPKSSFIKKLFCRI